jgi:hypothetical protein
MDEALFLVPAARTVPPRAANISACPPRFEHIRFGVPPQIARYQERRTGHSIQSARSDVMPDYEIRLFHADGSLVVVHVSHHTSDEEAHSHARRLKGDHVRYEVLRDGAVLRGRR